MKFRTFLLAVCMVVVPTLAMFSHHLPAGTRRSVRDCVSGVQGWLSAIAAPSVSTAAGPDAGVTPTPAVTAHDGQPDISAPDVGAPAAGLPEAPPRLASLDEVLRQLTDLGAVAIDCVDLPGVAGRHLASCQVALDSERQLHRVFQAEGDGPEAATRRLLDEVATWKRRTATRGVGESGAGLDGRSAPRRF